MEFLEPSRLWCIVFVFLVWPAVLMSCRNREKKIIAYGRKEVIEKTSSMTSFKKNFWRTTFIVSGVVCSYVFVFAKPHILIKEAVLLPESVACVIALDSSHSMDAEDVKPSRIDEAKKEISKFIYFLGRERGGGRMGFVFFAKLARRLSDLTFDLNVLQLSNNLIKTSLFDPKEEQGTNIPAALIMAKELFDRHEKDSKEKLEGKFVILLSDGQVWPEQEAILQEALGKLNEDGVVVFTVGIGLYDDVPIPSYDADRVYEEKMLATYNPESLQMIASATGGKYSHVTESGELRKTMEKMVKSSKFSKEEVKERKDISWIFLLCAFILTAIWGWHNFIQGKIFKK